jgi:hypothetical protein
MRVGTTGTLLLSCLLCMLSCPLCVAQVEQAPVPRRLPRTSDGGTREVLESIVIPGVLHAPFSATLATEWVKYSADGATMTLVNERHLARDGQGRIYQERWGLVPKNGSVKSPMTWIQIADPERRVWYNCSPQTHVCDRRLYDPAIDLSAASRPAGSSHPLPQGDGFVNWEELGGRNILGVETVGVRETTTLNPGVMGNDQPLTSMREYWHSDQLGINLLSTVSSPVFGKQVFTITEINPGEPDPHLFDLPAGYRVRDQNKNSVSEP